VLFLTAALCGLLALALVMRLPDSLIPASEVMT